MNGGARLPILPRHAVNAMPSVLFMIESHIKRKRATRIEVAAVV